MKKLNLVILFCLLGVYSYSQIPNPPTLIYPADSALVCTLTPSMDWSDVQGAESYRIQVSTSINFETTVINVSGLTNSGFQVLSGFLTYSTTYFWRVKTVASGGESNWSILRRFTTGASTPTQVILLSPPNGAINVPLNPTFNWSSVPYAVMFRFQILSGSTLILDTIFSGNFNFPAGILTGNTFYSWRIAGINNCGQQGPWSNYWNFTTVSQIPEAPLLISPPNNSYTHSPVFLDWSDVQGASYYKVQISNNPFFTEIISDSNVITQSNLTVNLSRGIYYWRVRAINNGSSGPWSPVWNFYLTCFISGTVKYNDNNQSVTNGTVKAFKLDKNSGNIIVLDSTSIHSDGSYMLENVPLDSLDIGVFPNSTPPNDWVITYYPSTIYWQNAIVLYPTGNLSNINIRAMRMQASTANNSVNGKVTRFTDALLSNLKDTFLYAKNGNTFVRCTVSDFNGVFHLLSLPAGNLKIIVTRLGFNSDSLNVNVTTTSNTDSVNFYLYRLNTGIKQINNIVPSDYKLFQNYPNPFNPVTNIRFYIKENDFVSLKVFNILGKEVSTLVNEKLSAGEYEIQFNNSQLASGIYLYTLNTPKFMETKKMLLIK